MGKQQGFNLMDMALAAGIAGVLAVTIVPYFIDIKSESSAKATLKLASTAADTQSVCYTAMKAGLGSCTPATTCDGIKSLLVGGVWPNGLVVSQGSVNGCRFTFNGYVLDNYQILGI